MKRVGILNVTGYVGAELARLLHSHPDVRIEAVTGRSAAGKRLPEVFPHLWQLNLPILEALPDGLDAVFSALSHAAAADGLRALELAVDQISGEFDGEDVLAPDLRLILERRHQPILPPARRPTPQRLRLRKPPLRRRPIRPPFTPTNTATSTSTPTWTRTPTKTPTKTPTRTPTPHVKCADVDGSGTVTLSDALQISLRLGLTSKDSGYRAKYDLNSDRRITTTDVAIAVSQFGRRCRHA